MNKKNMNEVNNEAGESNSSKMLSWLKMMNHNEKMIARLEKKIANIKEANLKLNEQLKSLIG